jgi:hypothetical protein
MSRRIACLICLLWFLPGCVASPGLPRPEPAVLQAVEQAVIAPRTPTPLPTIVPAEQVLGNGLLWRECALSDLDWRQAEACLGYAQPALKESGTVGTRLENGEWMLRVDGAVDGAAYGALYETRTWERFGLLWASLYKDGRRVHTFIDRASGFSPALSLRLIDDQVAWAFSGERVHTIAYGGRDLRAVYDLDAAYAPYEVAGKLIFVGVTDGAALIVYDGERMGPSFDQIITAHCCEIGLYAPFGADGRYGFWGQRDGRTWMVEIAAAGQAGARKAR